METILGIDLGTTNSVVSIVRDGKPVVLEEDGQRLLPSIVGVDSQGTILVGYPARNQWALAPDRTVRSIKRKMGTDERVRLGDQSYTPQEISAIILRTLQDRAQRQLGYPVHKAVITVPAFFNEQQREATRQAGILAGLEVVRIINEPTAAALNYQLPESGAEKLLVYDLGGGTFDVSIVQVEQGVLEVLSSHGDTQLGGDDFDQLLLDYVCDDFQKQHDVDLRASLASQARVLRAVEEAKKQLSFEPFVKLQEEFISEKAGVPLHLTMELDRLDYERLIEPLLQKTLVCIDEALADANLSAAEIDRVILVGGASRTPLVHKLLQEQLQQPLHHEVDPDLCVATGAAMQGAMIAGIDIGPVLVDITPHTLGIECVGMDDDYFTPYAFASLIERNTALPASRSEVFKTFRDGQTAVDIRVFQGENDDVRFNEFIGEFRLEGLAEAKRDNPIVVRFDLDLNGILTVTATEKESGRSEQALIKNAVSGFGRDEAEQEVRQRIDDAFEGTALGIASALGQLPADRTSDQLQNASTVLVVSARALLDKAAQIESKANTLDAAEIRQLSGQLRTALETESVSEIEDLMTKLDDLTFYLQEA